MPHLWKHLTPGWLNLLNSSSIPPVTFLLSLCSSSGSSKCSKLTAELSLCVFFPAYAVQKDTYKPTPILSPVFPKWGQSYSGRIRQSGLINSRIGVLCPASGCGKSSSGLLLQSLPWFSTAAWPQLGRRKRIQPQE